LASVLAREPVWKNLPPNLHLRIRLLLERCLKKEPKDRYSGISDARVDIQEVIADPSGVFSPPIQTVQPRKKLQVGILWIVVAVVVAGIAVWMLKPPPAREPKGMVRFEYTLPEDQQLNIFGGLSIPLAVSPDGRQIVYSTNKGIYTRSVDELAARLITGTEVAHSVFFSPDSAWIGFFAEDKLKKVALSGGTPVTLLERNITTFGASWSADNTILFADTRGIMRVSANGGTPEVVVKPSGLLLFPQMLPDGKSVLYTVVASSSQGRVMVQSPRLGEPKELLATFRAHYISPGYIVYVLPNSNNASANMYAVEFDPVKLKVKSEPFLLVEGIVDGFVSDAGTLVYVPQSSGTAETVPATSSGSTLVWMNREGKEDALSAPSNWYHFPAISPDGTKVALSPLIPPGLDIYIWDLTRETLRRLTFGEGNNSLPIWTPDGKRIIFTSDREGNRGIYWKAADGTGEVEKLVSVPDKNLFAYCLSKDGKTLVVVETDSDYKKSDIGIVSMEGDHAVKLLLKEPHNETNPSISPDGKYMAYLSNEPGGAGIYVCPFPEVSKGKWQISGSDAEFARWSPDGRELYYNTKDAIMAVSVETEPSLKPGKTRKLFRAHLESSAGTSPSWDISPDGKRFLIVKWPERSGAAPPASTLRKMVVVLNWFEELKQKVPIR
jgi:Tol biopolymer transport system component